MKKITAWIASITTAATCAMTAFALPEEMIHQAPKGIDAMLQEYLGTDNYIYIPSENSLNEAPWMNGSILFENGAVEIHTIHEEDSKEWQYFVTPFNFYLPGHSFFQIVSETPLTDSDFPELDGFTLSDTTPYEYETLYIEDEMDSIEEVKLPVGEPEFYRYALHADWNRFEYNSKETHCWNMKTYTLLSQRDDLDWQYLAVMLRSPDNITLGSITISDGDITTDGQVDVRDAVLMARVAVGDKDATTTQLGLDAADMNKDGAVNDLDLTMLLRKLAKLD